MNPRNIVLVSLLALAAPLVSGCAVEATVPPPPAPGVAVVVAPPRPYVGARWVPAHWEWRRHERVWVEGVWL